jgi:predicted MFS family arabinose efflux permease
VGLALFARVPVDGEYVTDVLPSTILLGTGAGIAFPALATLAMSGATSTDAGFASGLTNTTTQVGAALGLAVLATLSSTRSSDLLEKGESSAVALTSGYRLAFLIGAALVVAAMVVAVTVVRPEQKATREPETEPESVRTAGGKVLSAGR